MFGDNETNINPSLHVSVCGVITQCYAFLSVYCVWKSTGTMWLFSFASNNPVVNILFDGQHGHNNTDDYAKQCRPENGAFNVIETGTKPSVPTLLSVYEKDSKTPGVAGSCTTVFLPSVMSMRYLCMMKVACSMKQRRSYFCYANPNGSP